MARPIGMPRPSAGEPESRGSEWLVAVAVLCVTWIVFLPALGGGFLPWDDESNLVTNRAWRGLGLPQLGWGSVGGWLSLFVYVLLLGTALFIRWRSRAWQRIRLSS